MFVVRLFCLFVALAASVQLKAALPESIIERYGVTLDWDRIEARLVPEERYWRTKDEWANSSERCELPLNGLRIALDPGHLGGEWAEAEGRNFRMSEEDFWVREGELVLEVAQRVQALLEPLGADVTLLRESSVPVNPNSPKDYLPELVKKYPISESATLVEQADYALMLQRRSVREAIVSGELTARARRINTEIQPDLVISLHINAVPWAMTKMGERMLSDQHHLHVLIFGAMSTNEIELPNQGLQLLKKLANDSGTEELALGGAFADGLAEATGLPATVYGGDHAVMCDPEQPYLWARNLHILRSVECPIVMLEPYVANSSTGYARIQSALASRAAGMMPQEDDILLEYSNAVVASILGRYAVGAD